MAIRTLICDVGGVLIHFDYTRFFRFLALVLGTEPEIARKLWTDRDQNALLYRFARGDIDLHGLWDGFAQQFGVRFSPDDEHAFRVFWLVESQGLIPASYALLRAVLKKYGLRCVSCTNVDPILGEDLREEGQPLHGFFDEEVQSCRVNAMKPEARMYERALEAAQAEPDECVFIDDELANVEAARAFGMHAIHFTGVPALKAALAHLGLTLT